MFEAARKCRDAGIRVTYNLIFGYPGEEERHRKETLRVMGQIAGQFENVTFSPNLFDTLSRHPDLARITGRQVCTNRDRSKNGLPSV